ncbi:MAG: FAD-dependent monooxygenase, partial [Solirubrobacterales bacterium]|nr:FAD-dependent monooxygenase [Solirubrobacterales bacterium]
MNGTGSITSGTPRRHRETKEQSVAIVGAGPTGVMLAIELARRGVNVRVLDRLSSPPTESRATGIHARTLEIFRQLGLVEEFLAVGQRLDGFALHTQRRRPVRVRWADLDTPYPFLLNLPQALTQRILDRHLESLGISVERGAEVTDVRQDAEHVELSVARVGGEGPQTVTVDWAVGCDGAHSIVRRRLGVSFDGDDYGQDWLMADLNLDPAPPRDHFHIHLHTPVAFVALPLPSGRFRIFLPQVPNRAAAPRTAPDMDEIKRLAAVRGPAGLSLSDPDLLAAFRCYRRSTSTLRHGRVLVAGDAAHIHTPAGGQGLNTGMQDAFNLAWKLALVAQGQAPVALLDSYQAERLPVAAGVLALSHAMVSAFNVPSARRRWLRDRILPAAVAVPPLRRRFTNRMAELSINYRGGPLTDSRTGPWRRGLEPGERLVDAPCLTSEGLPTSMLGLLSTRHTLFILAGERPDAHVVQALVAQFSRFGELLEPVILSRQGLADHGQGATDPNLRVHDRYRARGGKLLLVRPDGYLAADAAL